METEYDSPSRTVFGKTETAVARHQQIVSAIVQHQSAQQAGRDATDGALDASHARDVHACDIAVVYHAAPIAHGTSLPRSIGLGPDRHGIARTVKQRRGKGERTVGGSQQIVTAVVLQPDRIAGQSADRAANDKGRRHAVHRDGRHLVGYQAAAIAHRTDLRRCIRLGLDRDVIRRAPLHGCKDEFAISENRNVFLPIVLQDQATAHQAADGTASLDSRYIAAARRQGIRGEADHATPRVRYQISEHASVDVPSHFNRAGVVAAKPAHGLAIL